MIYRNNFASLQISISMLHIINFHFLSNRLNFTYVTVTFIFILNFECVTRENQIERFGVVNTFTVLFFD